MLHLFLLLIAVSSEEITTQGRIVVLISNLTVGNESALTRILDVNHSRAIQYGRGMYTVQNTQAFDQESFLFFLNTFGPELDFRNATFNPLIGGFPIAKAILFQYNQGVNISGPQPVYNFIVSFDSDHLNRGITGGWRFFPMGNLVFMTGAVNSTVGALLPGDVVAFADYNLVRLAANNWCLDKNRDKLRLVDPFSTKTVINQFGTPETFSKLRVLDEDGDPAYGNYDTTYAGVDFGATPLFGQIKIIIKK